ncbi:unnamed protein product, partial [Ectocarpus sp. 12 AP-2014]
MEGRWTRQAEAFSALKAALEEARKEEALRKGQSRSKKDHDDQQEQRQKERETQISETERRLRELREKRRKQTRIIEERHRERCESYLMWREQTRQEAITKDINAKREARESHELVMMRR